MARIHKIINLSASYKTVVAMQLFIDLQYKAIYVGKKVCQVS